ncbi:hypothetical protein WMY93_029856 [Mugilogobius chulae]|uniref:Reverse transcriptase n=1 Tax=Mugilogobius chulae TaxID=88201 RepID=A0AAW0ML05_9GOBI
MTYKADHGDLKVGKLKEMDKEIKKVKQWLHLEGHTTDGVFYSRFSDGGINITKLEDQILAMRTRRILSLRVSGDPTTNTLVRKDASKREVERAWKALTGSLPRSSVDKLNIQEISSRSIKEREFSKWAKQDWQGKGIACFRSDPVSNTWLANRSKHGLSESEFILALKIRTRTFPPTNLQGKKPSLPLCRLCKSGPESVGHITCACKNLKTNRRRHNNICQFLFRLAKENGWCAKSEPVLISAEGKMGRPDLVLWRTGTVLMIDVAVCMETDQGTLQAMALHKVQKYQPFKGAVYRLDPSIRKVQVWGFPVGARGKWHHLNNDLLREITRKSAKGIMHIAARLSKLALFGSIKICKAFIQGM